MPPLSTFPTGLFSGLISFDFFKTLHATFNDFITINDNFQQQK